MKTHNVLYYCLISLALSQLIACSKKSEMPAEMQTESRYQEEKDYSNSTTVTVADTTSSPYYLSSSAAEVKDKANDLFIRTADMKFKVKNVYAATIFIENITAQFGGYVSYTQLATDKGYVEYAKSRKDSTVVLTPYTVTNSITLKVPNDKLDSALRSFVSLSEFLDYRTITANDMSLTLWAEQQKQARLKKHSKRLSNAIDKKAAKLNETNDAEGSLLDRQAELDNSQLSSQAIRLDIAYSTVKLQIYQNPHTHQENIAKQVSVTDFAPSFLEKFGEAFIDSIELLGKFFIILANIWWVLLLMIGVIWAVRYFRKK
jgi:hypothetical protein